MGVTARRHKNSMRFMNIPQFDTILSICSAANFLLMASLVIAQFSHRIVISLFIRQFIYFLSEALKRHRFIIIKVCIFFFKFKCLAFIYRFKIYCIRQKHSRETCVERDVQPNGVCNAATEELHSNHVIHRSLRVKSNTRIV
jgi:hypothetical protein